MSSKSEQTEGNIIYFEYARDIKGRLDSKVTLYLWNKDFFTKEVSIPLKIPTRFVVDDTKIKESFERLKNKYGSKVKLIPIKQGKWKLYHLETPFLTKKEMKEELSKDFLINYSINDYLRLKLGFPFSRFKEGRILKPTLEEIINAPGVAMDFETHNWKYLRNHKKEASDDPWLNEEGMRKQIEKEMNRNRGERITVASLSDLKHNYIITTFDTMKNFKTDIFGKTYKVKVIKASDQEELISILNELISEIKPLFIYGHNQLTFDYRKASELTQGLKFSTDKSLPKTISRSGFMTQTINKGKVDIDPAGYSFYCMFNRNNKMDTVYEHLFNRADKKIITHEELFELSDKAEKGDKKAGNTIVRYAISDAIKSYLIGEALKEEHIWLSRIYNNLPAKIDTVGKKTLVSNYWEKRYLINKRTWPTIRPKEQINYQIDKKFDDFDETKYIINRQQAKKGIFTAYLSAYFPLQATFKDILTEDKDIRSLYKRIEETNDRNKKYRLLKNLEDIASYIFFKYLGEPKWFKITFNKNPEKYTKINPYIEGMLNKHNNIILLEKPKDSEEILTLGKCKAISLKKSKFAVNLNNQLYLFGMSDFDSNKSERCDFEKDLFKNFFNYALMENNLEKALSFVSERIHDLKTGRINEDELKYKRVAKRDYLDYSAGAKQRWVKKIREKKALEQDEIVYYHDVYDKLVGKNGGLRETLDPLFKNKYALKKVYDGSATIKDILSLVKEYELPLFE